MAVPPGDPDRYRRQQRRRAAIAWGTALVVVAFVALSAVFGSGDRGQVEPVDVPYGETMTSGEYETLDEGEGLAEVLGRLGKSGRPESLTEDYVLVLFPPPADDVVCTYWEFSDELEIFARLCFDRDGGELVEKLDRNVHEGIEGGGGTITA